VWSPNWASSVQVSVKGSLVIPGHKLSGPYSLPPLLTGTIYYDFSRKVIPELLQDVDLQIMVYE
jgi:hypothetical protein